jgi:Icc protein
LVGQCDSSFLGAAGWGKLVVLDFIPDAPSQFAMEPPGYLLHRWNAGQGMTSYGVSIGDYEGPYPFYEGGKLID